MGRLYDLIITQSFRLGLREFAPIKGKAVWKLVGPDGKIKQVRVVPNTITESGDKITADSMSDRGEAQLSHMAIGTTSGGKTTASNALEAEVARVANDSRTQGAAGADNDVVIVATFPAATGTGAIVEAGLFNDAAAGDLYAYQEFAVINKGAADALIGTWTITYGAS